jgi:hypothetical protein
LNAVRRSVSDETAQKPLSPWRDSAGGVSEAGRHHPDGIRQEDRLDPRSLNELIKGKRGITAEAALDLAKALGTSAMLWMNLQATYDLDQAIKRRKAA